METIERYLDLRRADFEPELFAAALAVRHLSRLIARGGSEYGRPDGDDALRPAQLEGVLTRAVEAAAKTGLFEQEWRRLQRIFPRMNRAWEKGIVLFQADLTRATTHQEEMEYFSKIDFAEDCYASINARKTYPEDAACQAWASNGYMVAWWQHFFPDEDPSP